MPEYVQIARNNPSKVFVDETESRRGGTKFTKEYQESKSNGLPEYVMIARNNPATETVKRTQVYTVRSEAGAPEYLQIARSKPDRGYEVEE